MARVAYAGILETEDEEEEDVLGLDAEDVEVIEKGKIDGEEVDVEGETEQSREED